MTLLEAGQTWECKDVDDPHVFKILDTRAGEVFGSVVDKRPRTAGSLTFYEITYEPCWVDDKVLYEKYRLMETIQ